ncbi:MAG: hypothetical protein ABI664_23270 [bacterium]
MRSPRQSLTRASSIGFGTLFLALTYACTERAIAPTAHDDANDFAVSGILTSSLWRVNGSDLSFAGTVSANAHITQDRKGVRQDVQAPTLSSEMLAAPAATQRFGLSTLHAPSTSKLALREGAQVTWRTKFQSPRVNLTTRDGKRVSLQKIADPRGGGRPPVATMLYDGDRPVSMVEALYEKDGKRWKPTRSRITIFGKDGKPSAVTENNIAALAATSSGTVSMLVDGFRRVGGTLSTLVQPDVLYAATSPNDDGEGQCFKEAVALAAAATAQVAADIALGIALAACAGTLISCPAVLAAIATVAATSAVYLIRVVEYDACMNPPETTTTVRSNDGGGGGGGSEGDGCHDVTWEISYDGGWSWHYYDTQRICGGIYEM